MKLKIAILVLFAWSPLLLAQDAPDDPADAVNEGPRTGFFRINMTTRALLGDDGASALSDMFSADICAAYPSRMLLMA